MNINRNTGKGMFEADVASSFMVCNVCRWSHSEMCPRQSTFVGRVMSDLANFDFTSCHRFCMTTNERERRWKIVMDKMHENIEIE